MLAIVAGPMTDGLSQAPALLAQDVTPTLGFDRFGARFLAAVADKGDEDDNVVFSPLSAGVTLSLASLGARGATAQALSRLLDQLSLDRRALDRLGARTIELLDQRTDVQLEIANAIWVDPAVQLSPSFAASVLAWKATASSLRLSSPDAMRAINRWADHATHGRITEILHEPLDSNAGLFLANAVYFRGKWAEAFDTGGTHPRDFVLASGRHILVPTMERTGQVAYRRTGSHEVVRLPYRGGRTAMYVVLPAPGVAISTLLQEFATKGWPATFGGNAEREVYLRLPKFHVERGLDLRLPLEKLGTGIIFDCNRADFSDLAVARSTGTPLPLCVDKATQKIFIEVNEEGTEAAAVTGIEMVVTSAPPPPLDFIVNRPFLFVLRDESSGSDLFVGIIRRPQV